MKIYMASSWKNVNEVRIWAQFLRDQGHEVDDFTDNSRGRYVFFFKDLPGHENLNAITLLEHEPAMKAFIEDRKYIDWADVVFLLLPCGKSAHLEAGYAKGSGKKLIIFQEQFPTGEFDVMYGFADLITNDTEKVLQFLESVVMEKCSFCNKEVMFTDLESGLCDECQLSAEIEEAADKEMMSLEGCDNCEESGNENCSCMQPFGEDI